MVVNCQFGSLLPNCKNSRSYGDKLQLAQGETRIGDSSKLICRLANTLSPAHKCHGPQGITFIQPPSPFLPPSPTVLASPVLFHQPSPHSPQLSHGTYTVKCKYVREQSGVFIPYGIGAPRPMPSIETGRMPRTYTESVSFTGALGDSLQHLPWVQGPLFLLYSLLPGTPSKERAGLGPQPLSPNQVHACGSFAPSHNLRGWSSIRYNPELRFSTLFNSRHTDNAQKLSRHAIRFVCFFTIDKVHRTAGGRLQGFYPEVL